MSLSRILKRTKNSRDTTLWITGSPNGVSRWGSQLLVLFSRSWDFELVHAGSEEVAKPRFESHAGVEYELRENGIQSLRLSRLQAYKGSSKILRPKCSEIL